LALVSMKGSPYSCKQLVAARWQPGGDSPSPATPGTPLATHPTLAHLGQLLPILPLDRTLLGRVHLVPQQHKHHVMLGILLDLGQPGLWGRS